MIPVPDSGTPAAQGYARASGLPFADGLIKNRYVGRTFIQPDQALRDHGVRLKFNPLRARDRGPARSSSSTTRSCAARRRARSCRCCATRARARCTCASRRRRSSRPATTASTWPRKDELIAAGRSLEEIRAHLGADSLAYLSLEGLQLAIERPADRFCRACLTGDYPVPVPEAIGAGKLRFEREPARA